MKRSIPRSMFVSVVVLLAGGAVGLSALGATPPAPAGSGPGAQASAAPSASAVGTAAPTTVPSATDSAATGAPAGTSAPSTEPDAKVQAQALLSEGNRLLAEADFNAALDKYRAAYELFPAAKLLINIGTVLRHLGRNAEAADTYERYLSHPEADPGRGDELKRILREIDQLTGRVRIALADRDAHVRLDGKSLSAGEWSKPLRLDPGEHTVVAEKAGFVTVVRTVTLKMRDDIQLPIVLLKPGQAPPVIIEAGAGDTQRVVGYVLGAAGIAGLGAGAIFGGLALSTDADAADHCMADNPSVCDTEGASLGETARTQGTLSTVFLIAGGALLATGFVVWIAAPSADDAVEGASAALVVGPGPGLGVVGRW